MPSGMFDERPWTNRRCPSSHNEGTIDDTHQTASALLFRPVEPDSSRHSAELSDSNDYIADSS